MRVVLPSLRIDLRPGNWAVSGARRFVWWLDRLLSRIHHVREFTQEEGCIFRVSTGKTTARVVLADGLVLQPGEKVGELHLWNQRMRTFGPNGPDFERSIQFYRALKYSFRTLAAYLDSDPELDAVRAFRGEMAFARSDLGPGLKRFLSGLGFEVKRPLYPPGFRGRFVEFWQNFYTWMLMWAFNPRSVQGKKLTRLRRYELWMSMKTLSGRYGVPQPPTS